MVTQAAVTSITLTDPVSGRSSVIMPRDGVTAQILDVQPAARAVEEDRVSGHGAYDTTRYMGPAAVALTLLLWPGATQTVEAFWDEISPLLDPSLRPVLTVTNTGWPQQRQITLRFDSVSKPFSDPTNWQVLITWHAPDAVWQSVTMSEYLILPSLPSPVGVAVKTTGLHVATTGLHMPATTYTPGTNVTGGGAASTWQCRLYGPCSGPALINDTAGQSIIFTGSLTLAAGDYVFLDSQLQTAKRASDGADVTNLLDFAQTTWWQLGAGTSLIRFAPASASPGSEADLIFRPSWIA